MDLDRGVGQEQFEDPEVDLEVIEVRVLVIDLYEQNELLQKESCVVLSDDH